MQYDEKDFVETATPQLIKQIAKARKLTKLYYDADNADKARRREILTELFGYIGSNVEIDVPFHCDHGDNINIGDNVIIGMNCTFVDNAPIKIGNNVMIASNVQLYTSFHPVEAGKRLTDDRQEKSGVFFRTLAKPIAIEDGAWIGGGVVILPGVTIGKNSVIGAGSVVTRSIPENCVAVGNPCKVLRRIEQ